jgi:hypothetical protein
LNGPYPHEEGENEKVERLVDTISCFWRAPWIACNPQSTRPLAEVAAASQMDGMFTLILNLLQPVHVWNNCIFRMSEEDFTLEYVKAICHDYELLGCDAV